MTLKRIASPKFWPIERKTKKFVTSPTPGPHRKFSCIPLGVVIRDILGYSHNAHETKAILNSGSVAVDRKMRRTEKFPVGIMDMITIGDENYVILPDRHGMRMSRIDKEKAGTKLLRIENKAIVKKKRVQLNFHDGRNALVEKDDYKTGDVVVMNIETNSIKDLIKLEKGATAVIIGGSNVGSLCKVDGIIVTKSPMPNQVLVDIGGRKLALPKHYVFAVGRDKPAINFGEQA